VKRARFEWITTPLLLAVFLLVWHYYVSFAHVSAFILPGPAAVGGAFVDLAGERSTWGHVAVTLREILGGFAAASAAGIGLGVLVGKMPWLDRTLRPFIVAAQLVPKVALAPLFVVWFGFGGEAKILVSAVLAFFPIFSNTALGVRSVDAGHAEVMTSLNAGLIQRLLCLDLPSAAPLILAGMEVGIVFAVVGCIVAEFLGGNAGLGYMLVAEMNAYQTDLLFAVILLLTAVGFVCYTMIWTARRLLTPWTKSVDERR
jgi:NitT/TauT family transport system permease protein